MTTVYFTILRPSQWLKNLMLFFPPFLGGQMLLTGQLARGATPFFAFCLVSSAGYVFNDILDRNRDACHPSKNERPIPAGKIGVTGAGLFSALLLIGGLALGSLNSTGFLMLLLSYAAVTLSYSLVLKSFALIDLLCISSGFLLRLEAGGEVFKITISPWLFLSVFLLAVFLSTGKRLCESRLVGNGTSDLRKNLPKYPAGFLEGTMYMTGGSVLVTYAMYAVLKPKLIYTIPLCLIGLLRYILRVSSGENGDPTESLLKDWVLFAVSSVWLLMVIWSIYR